MTDQRTRSSMEQGGAGTPGDGKTPDAGPFTAEPEPDAGTGTKAGRGWLEAESDPQDPDPGPGPKPDRSL